jgi:hypothetical protein
MILDLGISLLAVAAFAAALWWSGVTAATQRAVQLSTGGLMAMLDGQLDDRAKEVAVRRAGLALVVASFGILWRTMLALAAAAAPILLADALGLVSRDEVFELMVRWDYVVAVSVVGILLAVLVRRRRPAAADEDAATTNRNSTADQLVHAIAFSSPRVQRGVSRLEDRVLSKGGLQPTAPPIFVTSLARGGTTALLYALHAVPGVATHTYRDMPFLTAPDLWNRVAGGKRRRVDRHERAHGDGLEIDLDTPEAFEEVIWKMYWPEKYRVSSIELWRPDDRKEDAERFLAHHMAKVVDTRRGQGRDDLTDTARYCSKNNANIARLSYLRDVFPGGHVVVPIRRPECHAASLLRQHRNFLGQQAEDDFVQRYMRDIGHFEFGLIHTPMAFPGFDADRYDPATGDYWLHYWIQAFREVLEHGDDCVLVTQDDLRSAPLETMASLCGAVGLDADPRQFAGQFRSTPDQAPTSDFDPRLHDEATELYRELELRAVSPQLRPAP